MLQMQQKCGSPSLGEADTPAPRPSLAKRSHQDHPHPTKTPSRAPKTRFLPLLPICIFDETNPTTPRTHIPYQLSLFSPNSAISLLELSACGRGINYDCRHDKIVGRSDAGLVMKRHFI